MKKFIKYIFGYLVAILPMALGAQTQTENHVVSKTYKKARTTKVTSNHTDSVATSIQYFDGFGRAKQSVLVKAGSGYGNNALPYDWSTGTPPTSSGFYNLNGAPSENQIINGTTPFGDTDLIWECVNGSDTQNNADGGWATDYFSIDNTKSYRYTVWVKKTGNLNDGAIYDGTQNVDNLDGSSNANPNFWSGDLPALDSWYLMVGVIHPSNYSGIDTGVSGVYDMQGNKVLDGAEFKWNINTVDTRFKSYLYYANDPSVRLYFWSPLVQKIDGSEIALDDLITTSQVINNQEIEAKDIVTHYEYDGLGRQIKDFLPYASEASNGNFNSSADQQTQSYYLNKYANDFAEITDPTEVNAFSEKFFEDSALNRIVEQTAPGKDWKPGSNIVTGKEYTDGHTIKIEYDLNTIGEVNYYPIIISLSNNIYTPTLDISNVTTYNQGELTKTITKDENWTVTDGLNHTTEEFKDKSGQVVLKRTYNNSLAHDTYYIYDDYGNLSFVLPPKASDVSITNTVLDELCYQYKYDHRNRLVEKKIPGKGWEYIVYDKLDRPILTQDALQRAKPTKEWLFTKYDPFGRVIFTGVYKNNGTRETIQGSSDISTQTFESFDLATTNGLFYYTNNTFPTNITYLDVLTITYYDDYVYWSGDATNPTTNTYGVTLTANTKGLTTTSKVKVLGTSDWITSITGYDDKARPIYIYSKNDYLGTTDIIESKLDFVGKVLETKTTHQKTGKDDIVTIDRFEYDHQDRLINQTQKVNDQFSERIVRNNYDDLGQLESKLTGNGTQKGFTDVSLGVSISNDTITKTGPLGWNAGLATLGNFNGDGYIEFTATQDNKLYSIGLSNSNVGVSYATIEFAIYLYTHKTVVIHESGSSFNPSRTYESGDVFRIERIGDKIHYKQNGETIYISTKTSSGSLLGDISLNYPDTQIKDLHIVDNSKGLQNVDYTYNVRGWLKNINQDAQNDNDLFNFTLRYNDPTSGTALYNGNISQTSWNTLNTDTSTKTYTYSYDALNRILSGVDNTGNYNLTSVGYDKNGNILNLQRQGHIKANASEFGVMDNLNYTYDSGNKLTKVADSGNTDFGFKDGTNTGDDYIYDVNGNMISDNNKGITSITYNHLNLPTSVEFSSQNAGITYVYDAAGMKLKKIVSGSGISTTTTDYAGNHIYENGDLQFFNHAEGYVKAVIANGSAAISSFDYIYQYKDHLGNVRLSYADTDGSGDIDENTEIVEESNYYPFGLKHKGYNNAISANGNSVAQKLGFTGKEHQDELGLGWIDITARNYDAALGRWMNIDPLAEQGRRWSPYNYAMDSPIYFMDPDGMWPFPPGTFSRAWNTVKTVAKAVYKTTKNIVKSTELESVSAAAGVGIKYEQFEAKASIAEFKYSFGKETFSFTAVKLKGSLGTKMDNIKGEINIAYGAKNYEKDAGEGGFIKLKGSKTSNFEKEGGSIAIFAKNEEGEKGAYLIEDINNKGSKIKAKVSENVKSFGLKIGIGLNFSFDANKFKKLQEKSQSE